MNSILSDVNLKYRYFLHCKKYSFSKQLFCSHFLKYNEFNIENYRRFISYLINIYSYDSIYDNSKSLKVDINKKTYLDTTIVHTSKFNIDKKSNIFLNANITNENPELLKIEYQKYKNKLHCIQIFLDKTIIIPSNIYNNFSNGEITYISEFKKIINEQYIFNCDSSPKKNTHRIVNEQYIQLSNYIYLLFKTISIYDLCKMNFPINTIIKNNYNNTYEYTFDNGNFIHSELNQKSIELLINHISQHGLISPIIIYIKDNNFYVYDVFQCIAALYLGYQEINVCFVYAIYDILDMDKYLWNKPIINNTDKINIFNNILNPYMHIK